MNWWYTVFITVSFSGIVKTQDIQSKINKYFKTDAAETFARKWKLYEKMFENTIAYALQQQFGHISMNMYMNKYVNPMELSQGYYHTDNQVHLIFVNVGLSELPYIFNTQVNFPLHSNVLSFEASMSKLIVETNYILFRNKSDIIFSIADQDPYKNSPFLFQQVKTTGDLAISITGCTISGVIVSTLSGDNVNLGHHQVKLKDCQYSLEISSTGTGAPPVIANYLPNGEKGSTLETLLLRPLLQELIPKLQATLFSDVNTSAIFTNKLAEIRENQDQLFEDTKDYLDDVVRSMNKKSIENNMGTMNLADFIINWDDVFSTFPDAKSIHLTKMVLVGLDTIYSSHSGGPIRLSGTQIIEQLRFSTLEIMGSIRGGKGVDQDYEFALEITDYAVDVTFDSNLNAQFEVLGWRYMDFSCSKLEFLPTESFVVGYLLRELPKRIISHLNSVYSNRDISQLHHALDTDEGHIQESANDGKYETNSDSILDKENKLDEPPMDIISAEELNNAVGPEQTKLNLVNVKPHLEEQGQVKLHHIEASPHEDEEGLVKLHHVAALHHDEEHDKVILNDDGNKAGELTLNKQQEQEHVKLLHVAAEPHEEDQGQVKLHHVAASHHDEEHDKVILNNVGNKAGILTLNNPQEQEHVKLLYVAAEPHEEDQGQVKLHHVAASHHDEEHDKVILNDDGNKRILTVNNAQEQEHVKLLHVAAEPYVADEGPVKLHHIALQHEATNEDKASKGIARKNVNEKKGFKIQRVKARGGKLNKITKSFKRLNQVTPKTSKSIQ